MAHVLNDAQRTLSGHRKLAVVLRHIHTRAIALGTEQAFNHQFTILISKVFKQRKGVQLADRIAKFCSVFVDAIVTEETKTPFERLPEQEDLDSPGVEFVHYLISHLLRGIDSKFKEVRYRVVQILAYLVNYITELDEQLFKALEVSLKRRLGDKEPIVRIQAIVAISRFQHSDNAKEAAAARQLLLSSAENDDLPEVRRAALLNLEKTPQTLPYILARARDVNGVNRRLVYSRILKEAGSFTQIPSEWRVQLLSWGLNDRDPSVNRQAVSILAKFWLSLANDDILQLIESLQIIGSPVALDAVDAILTHRSELVSKVEITPETWKELTVEKAFFFRAYFEFCNKHDLHANIEKNLPELTKLSQTLQEYFRLRNSLCEKDEGLVDKFRSYENKRGKLEKVLDDTHSTYRDISLTLAASQKELEGFERKIERVQEALSKKKKNLSFLKREKENAKDDYAKTSLEKRTANASKDVLDLELQLTETESTRDKIAKEVREMEEELANVEIVQTHQETERQNLEASNADFMNKYEPFAEQIKELEFVIEQLLYVIHGSDFADVAGTRRLTPVITNALRSDRLPEQLISICVRILRKVSVDDNYFSGMCIEIITDIRDAALSEHDETFTSAVSMFEGYPEGQPEEDEGDRKRRKADPVTPPEDNLKQCLMVLVHYLEVVEVKPTVHHFDLLIETLIRPAVLRDSNLETRLLGSKSLGLFSLIDREMAASNLKFFGFVASGSEIELEKDVCIKVLFDVLLTHGVGILGQGEESVDTFSLARLFVSLLNTYEMPRVQATTAEGLCKLFLADLLIEFGKDYKPEIEGDEIDEAKLLKTLLLAYFNPRNSDNHELKQILAYCVPAYAFSKERHQRNVAEVAAQCFYEIFLSDSGYIEDDEVLSASTVLQQLIHWADPQHIARATSEETLRNPSHLIQAKKLLLITLLNVPKAAKKTILLNLSRLTLHEMLGLDMLRDLHDLIVETRNEIVSRNDDPEFSLDMASFRALDKFAASVEELIAKAEEMEAATEKEEREKSVLEPRDLMIEEKPVVENTGVSSKIETETDQEMVHEDEDGKPFEENPAPETPRARKAPDLSAELAEIDDLLDAEAEVEYDVA